MGYTKKFLIILVTVIFIGLVLILFVLPDSFFLAFYESSIPTTNEPINNNKKTEFKDYNKQQEALLENNYRYSYVIVDSMGKETIKYECEGTKNGETESGICSSPKSISYTEKNIKEIFSSINQDFINVEYIFNYIKDIQPEVMKYNQSREYKYETNIKDLKTDITIYTDKENITKIYITNAYMQYLLNYEL